MSAVLYDGVVTTRRSVIHDGRGCVPSDCLRNVFSHAVAPEESTGLGTFLLGGFAELTAMTSESAPANHTIWWLNVSSTVDELVPAFALWRMATQAQATQSRCALGIWQADVGFQHSPS